MQRENMWVYIVWNAPSKWHLTYTSMCALWSCHEATRLYLKVHLIHPGSYTAKAKLSSLWTTHVQLSPLISEASSVSSLILLLLLLRAEEASLMSQGTFSMLQPHSSGYLILSSCIKLIYNTCPQEASAAIKTILKTTNKQLRIYGWKVV